MNAYKKNIDIRWSDLDPNFHVTHTAYYNFAAHVRVSFLNENGLGMQTLQENRLGPILFREECVFKREIYFGEQVEINLELTQSTDNYSRWTFRHEVVKQGNILCAIMTVDGAWIDTSRRKLTIPPLLVSATFDLLPRSADFKWIEKSKSS